MPANTRTGRATQLRAPEHGRNACVMRVTTEGHPGLERSKDSVAQCSGRTVNGAGLFGATRLTPVGPPQVAFTPSDGVVRSAAAEQHGRRRIGYG